MRRLQVPFRRPADIDDAGANVLASLVKANETLISLSSRPRIELHRIHQIEGSR